MFNMMKAGVTAITLLAATPALAATTIEHVDSDTSYTSVRDPGSAPAGLLSVDTAQTIQGFGVDVDLHGDGELTFLIFDASNGSILYKSAAKAFADTGAGYKYSDAFTFTFAANTTYALAAWTNGGGDYLVDFTANTVGAFHFLTGNQNVTYDTLQLGQNCCDVATSLVLGSAVPEPATWAMMIVGFGAVGSLVRTSRRRNAFSAA